MYNVNCIVTESRRCWFAVLSGACAQAQLPAQQAGQAEALHPGAGPEVGGARQEELQDAGRAARGAQARGESRSPIIFVFLQFRVKFENYFPGDVKPFPGVFPSAIRRLYSVAPTREDAGRAARGTKSRVSADTRPSVVRLLRFWTFSSHHYSVLYISDYKFSIT